ncbi:MAG: putative isomerase [Saprospiraceae bacterium]|nr:MAG: putative isomerase [Saprospiraceae bacterium]
MKLELYQVDAFTDALFGGNPAAVVPLQNWLPDELLQAIAAENNLSETAFFISKGDRFHIRWFTPVAEVALCGHATLATAHVLWAHLQHPADQLAFDSLSGPLGVSRQGQWYQLDFPTDKLEPLQLPTLLGDALGITPVETYKGREDVLVILETEAQLKALQPDFAQLKKLGGRGVICSAPGSRVDFVSRCFYPAYGIDEDPVTGSAHTTLTPYWAARLGKPELMAEQWSARRGRLRCRLDGDRTYIGGQAVTYLKGTIFLPIADGTLRVATSG